MALPGVRQFRLGAAALCACACFAEPQAPPAFRFACEKAADCAPDQVCEDSLCQTPCTQATFEQDCPSSAEYAACFNGFCAHLCDREAADACPTPQACQGFELPDFGSGGDGLDFGEIPEVPGLGDLGICGLPCSPERPCPGPELCVQGACLDPNTPGPDATEDDGGNLSTESGGSTG